MVRISLSRLFVALALVTLPAFLPGVASAQQTITTSTAGPIYGNGSSIDVTTSGTINGGGAGVAVISTGTSTTTTLTNAGLITAYSRGILNEATGSFGTITNSGTINAAGTGVYGVPSSTFGTVTNSGTISGADWGASLSTTGTVTNSAGAVIHGGSNGGLATIGNVGLIDNAGLIEGGFAGLETVGVTTLDTLTNSGTIRGDHYGGIVMMTSGTLTNSGLVSGTYVGLLTTGIVDTLTNTATGRIEGELILNGVATTVVNDGQIRGEADSGIGLGNYATAGTITNTGTITGAWGVYQNGTLTTFTNSATGLIHGDDIGFYADYTVDAIDNYGTITGNTTAGVEFDTSFSNIGVLTNHAGALIESSAGDGVLVGTDGNDYAADTVSNAGVIRGANSGVRVENGRLLSLVNTGTIASSGTGSGPAVVVGPAGILGDASGTKGPAISSTGTGALLAGSIVNSGTINQGFQIENQDVSVGAGAGVGAFNGGTLDVVDGNLTFTDGTLGLNADVSVNGGSGTFINQAILALAAAQNVTGNFQQSSAGTTLIELLGWTSGSYGHLGISGTADFAGELSLDASLLPGGLTGGHTLELFSFGSYIGGFSALAVDGTILESLGLGQWAYGSLTLTEVWTDTTMSLIVTGPAGVPEIDPNSFGSVLALVLGSLGMLERRRLKAA